MIVLNYYWVNNDIKGVRKMWKTNENEDKTYPNLWDTAKTVLVGKIQQHRPASRNTNPKQCDLPTKGTRKKRSKSLVSRSKVIVKSEGK